MRARVWLALGVSFCGAAACSPTVPSGAPAPSASPAPSALAPGPVGSAPVASRLPPPVERACTRDDECAVAKIGVEGEFACCPACGTTPGTRKWHATLQRYCGPRTTHHCPPLACPMGPTRAVCRAGVCEATHMGPDGKPVMILGEQRCLPAMVCDEWADCAHVQGNEQDGWFVWESSRVPRGEIAGVANVCTSGPCQAARLFPEGVQCPPHTIPPLIQAPPYTCRMDQGRCRRTDAR